MNTIESLKELYVKLGGSLEDVENKTTIPEMIDAITEVTGGEEPTYETVAEIPVGDGAYDDDVKLFVYNTDVESPETLSGELYFNTTDYPLTQFGDDDIFSFNAKQGDGTQIPDDPTKPMYFVNIAESTVMVASDTNALDNTTVRILKKVEQGGTTGGKLVVHITKSESGGETVYTADKTVEEIIAADAAGQVVECEYEDRRYGLISVVKEEDGTACNFVVAHASEAQSISAGIIAGESVDGVDTWELLEYDYFTLPAYDTTEDLGKVLTVTENGLAWVKP